MAQLQDFKLVSILPTILDENQYYAFRNNSLKMKLNHFCLPDDAVNRSVGAEHVPTYCLGFESEGYK